jgi:hypothetical protein
MGNWLRLNVSGGAVVQPLPDIGSTYPSPGQILIVSESSGTPGLTITPFAGDTIDGAPAAVAVPAGGALILIGDGISDWKIVARNVPSAIARWNVLGPFTSAAPPTAACEDLIQCDMSLGAFAVTLPAIAPANSGCEIAIKKVAGGAAAMTITPVGADTVEGAVTLPVGGALSSVTVVSDGVSNWMVI